jgi:hypothetical protein
MSNNTNQLNELVRVLQDVLQRLTNIESVLIAKKQRSKFLISEFRDRLYDLETDGFRDAALCHCDELINIRFISSLKFINIIYIINNILII